MTHILTDTLDATETRRACVLVADLVHPQLITDIRMKYRVDHRVGLSQDALQAILPDYDAIVLRSGVYLGAEEFACAPRLRIVGRAGVGVDNIDLEVARARGIQVFNVPDLSAVSVAEFTFALMLSVMRNVTLADRQLRDGLWKKPQLAGTELAGKTLGIVGLGRIGTCVARIAAGFGTQMIASVARYSDARARAAAQIGVRLVSIDALLAQADVISLHCPLIPQTRHLIDAAALERIKNEAFLINMSRGGVVDEAALLQALQTGLIAGAATDVFQTEGQPSPLMQLDRFVSAPHIGAMTQDAQLRIAQALLADLERGLSSQPIVNRIV
jgi:D-3-phosphoglycerate dehydrogenase / 2-oxoglutarate reductase